MSQFIPYKYSCTYSVSDGRLSSSRAETYTQCEFYLRMYSVHVRCSDELLLAFISRESCGAPKVNAENNDKEQAIASSSIVKISSDW